MADQKLIEYIQNSLARGTSKNEIYKELINTGWTIDVIQEGFNAIQKIGDKERTQQKTIRIIVIFGAILIGAGIFSFIAANWQGLGRVEKIAILIFAMLGFYAGGWFLKEKKHYEKTGGALIFLGSLVYGASVFLIAQMFHIRENWPDGFILWMIGAVAIGFALDLYPVFYLAIVVGFIAIISHPTCLFFAFDEIISDCFIGTSAFLLLSATAITFVFGWIIRKKIIPAIK
ncbi:MAG: DUF2157 domain-containing protein [Patescibacteria group bacterium]